ncbi:hypothetical protein LTR85_007559 [Meristemomyces frigidus]|nr:hypothetical protein LTR85_007559 [Meristemomyces frigidus]
MYTRHLKNQPQYWALSYCWGGNADNADKIDIEVNGRVGFHVTQSLKDALQRVRDEHVNRILWVDAVCIRQDNKAEKNAQTWIVQELISSTHETYVYFGHYETHWNVFTAEFAHPRLNDLLTLQKQFAQKTEQMTLFQLMRSTSKLKATVDSDKVYALLGLSSDRDVQRILPDYGKERTLLFKEVTVHFLSTQRTLDVLFDSWVRTGLSGGSLPTWIPDFCWPDLPWELKESTNHSGRDTGIGVNHVRTVGWNLLRDSV